METAIVALYQYGTFGQEAWIDHGAAITFALAKNPSARFVDMKSTLGRGELEQRLFGCDLVCFGLKSAHYDLGMEVVGAAVAVGAKVLVGGVHATAAPDELINNPQIDYIFQGESEITFPDFLKNPDKYDRIIKGKRPENLDALPFIDREIFREPVEDACGWFGWKKMVSIIVGRGCPYSCAFCQPLNWNHFGKTIRRRSVSNVIAELKILKQKYDPDFLVIHDDTFLLFPRWLEEFSEQYKQIGIPFWAAGRADGIIRYRKIVKKLVDVGWKIISVGYESGSQRILDWIDKQTTIEQNLEATRIIKETGAAIYANYILGFPTETKQEVMQTMKMADQIGAEIDSWAFFSPYPGNYLGDRCRDSGLSLLDQHNYNRYPCDSKIKNVDYDYLRKALQGFRE